MAILVCLLLIPVVTFFVLPLVVSGSFVSLAMTGHATNIITGLAVSLQATALLVAVVAASIWIAYSVGCGLYGARREG
jgi:Na+/H+-translocating membrane pyrophosphatase